MQQIAKMSEQPRKPQGLQIENAKTLYATYAQLYRGDVTSGTSFPWRDYSLPYRPPTPYQWPLPKESAPKALPS